MLRVLLISRCPPYPLHLGDRLIVWHLAEELVRRGHTLDLLAFTQSPDDVADIPQYAHLFDQITLLPEPARPPHKIMARLLFAGRRFPRRAGAAWSPAMWQAVAEHAASGRYAVAHLFGGIHVYEILHALGRLPALITPYESYSLYLQRELGLQRRLATRLRLWVTQRYEGFMFTPYARAVVVAQPDRAALQRIAPWLKVEVIPNGIDLGTFQPLPIERDPATILFTGNYEYAPNVDAALLLARTILPQVREQIPSARLQLVGHAPPPSLTALRSDAIDVTGRVADIRPYLAQATVYAAPLRLGAGIKNKVLEALAMGAPVVASPIAADGISISQDFSGVLAAPEQFAAALVRLLHDAGLRQRLSVNGRTLIEARYSWTAVAAQYERLYRSIAGE